MKCLVCCEPIGACDHYVRFDGDATRFWATAAHPDEDDRVLFDTSQHGAPIVHVPEYYLIDASGRHCEAPVGLAMIEGAQVLHDILSLSGAMQPLVRH
jgi:hypothetical protein